MATTFDVIFLGTVTDIDPTEGNQLPDNATAIEGTTLGSGGAPLWQNIGELALDNDANANNLYDQDNTVSNDTFTIDGGTAQVFDSVARYDATITYNDGSTDTATVIVIQDTAGNMYMTPQKSANADQLVITAKPIDAITLDTYAGSYWMGTRPDFEPAAFKVPICLTEGTCIETPRGSVPVEMLRPGDLVLTVDHGPQRLCWIGARSFDFTVMDATDARSGLPICFKPGSLGRGTPRTDLIVSPQHRIVLRDADGSGAEVLLPAKAFLGQPGVRQLAGKRQVQYFALLLDRHQILIANGAWVESFRPGPVALAGLSEAQRRDVAQYYPGLLHVPTLAVGPPARPLKSVGWFRRCQWQSRRPPVMRRATG